MNQDSLGSWDQALSGQYDDWYPVLMSLLMRSVVILFGNQIKYYTLLQSVSFYIAVFLLLKPLCLKNLNTTGSRAFLIASLLMALYPVGWIYSVTSMKDVLLAIFSCLLASSLIIYFQDTSKLRQFFFSSVFLGLAISVRHNAIFIFLGVAIAITISWILRRGEDQNWRKVLVALILSSSLLYSPILNTLANVQSSHVSTYQFSAQLVGYIRSYYDETGQLEPSSRRFLDQAMGTGTTEKLVRDNYECGLAWVFLMKPEEYNKERLAELEETVSFGVKGLIIKFFLAHPVSVIKHHFCVIGKLTNFSINSNTYWYDLPIPPNQFGIARNSRIIEISKLFPNVLEFAYSKGLSKHWFFLLILVIAALSVNRKRLSTKTPNYFPVFDEAKLVLPCIGISYFLSLCAVPVTFYWRYLLTPTLLAVILIATVLSSYLVNFPVKLKFRLIKG